MEYIKALSKNSRELDIVHLTSLPAIKHIQ